MGVGRADEAVLERIAQPFRFQQQSLFHRVTHVAACGLGNGQRSAAGYVGIDLKACPLIVHRQSRVRFRGALDLGDFNQRLIAQALFVVRQRHRVACPGGQFEHLSIGLVGIVRDSQALYALASQVVHPVP